MASGNSRVLVTEDEKIHDVVVAKIRRASMNIEEWQFTVIADIHPQICQRLALALGELPLVSAFLSENSWYAFTTRRIISHLHGETVSIDPTSGITDQVGNFKGYGGIPTEVATITTSSGAKVRFEYETGKASMAPIYASRYWANRQPVSNAPSQQ